MLVTPMLTLTLLAVGQPAPQAEFYQDLRRRQEVKPGIKMIGPYFAKYTFPEKEGLRVQMPSRREWPGAIGLETEFAISGDFEITGTYEILAMDMPAKPNALSGVNLWIRHGHDDKRFARLGRFYSRSQGNAYAAQLTDRTRARPTATANVTTEARAGQLRLVRQGATLSFQYADDSTEGDFQEVLSTDCATDDITMLRLVVTTSDQFNAVEARLIDLRIRGSGAVPDAPGDGVFAHSHAWTCAAAALVLAVLAGFGIALGIARHRQRRRSEAT
jgi:hypothetical protein